MAEPDLWHAPQPGPLYWSWRCLRCGEAVRRHPSWWRRLLHQSTEEGAEHD